MFQEDNRRLRSEAKEEEELTKIRFKCPFCNSKFRDFKSLRIHCKNHHSKVCPVCGKEYRSVPRHLSHQRDKQHRVAYGLVAEGRGYKKSKWFKSCRRLAYEKTRVQEPDVRIPNDLKKNPRFLPELGSWEGWLTPLRYAWKTHRLRIDHPELGPTFISYKPTDRFFVEFQNLSDEQSFTVTEQWHYELLRKWLERYEVEFVRRN